MKRIIFFAIVLFLFISVTRTAALKHSCYNKVVPQVTEQVNIYADAGDIIEEVEKFKKQILREKTPTPLSDEDFIVKNGSTSIGLGQNYKDLKTNEQVVSARYTNEKRAYDTYVYENFAISVGLHDIFLINLASSKFETARGIKVGDTLSDVFKQYGQTDSELGDIYSYHYNYKWIAFSIDEDGYVTNIHLDSL